MQKFMQKISLETTCYVCGAGAFGVFFRWLQNMLAFDDAGLNEKSALNLFVPALMIAGYFVFRRFVDRLHRENVVSDDFCIALYNNNSLLSAARWAAGLLMAAGAFLLVLTSETDPNAGMIRILCLLALLTGLSFPLVLGAANYDELGTKGLVRLGMLMPVLMFALWLILSYKENSYNSIIWSYAVEVFVLIAAMLAFFRVAGYAFQVVDTKKTLLSVMMGGMLCILGLADERRMGMQVILFAAALMLVIYDWVIIMNMKNKQRLRDQQMPESEPPRDNNGFIEL